MYSAKLDRVLIPIYDGDRQVGLQGRALHDWQKPKYLNLPTGGMFETLIYTYGNGVPVVTEDVLSAVAVGRVAQGVSILGTRCNLDRAARIAALGHERVKLWLDDDRAGRKDTPNVRRMLELAGMAVDVIRSPTEPKHTDAQLMKELIYGQGPAAAG